MPVVPVAVKRGLDSSFAERIAVSIRYKQYQGLQVKPIPKYENENFTVELTIIHHFPINKVEQSFHPFIKNVYKVENEYDVFILLRIVYEKQSRKKGI